MSYNSPEKLPQAISDLSQLLNQVNTFSDVKNLAQENDIKYLHIGKLWRDDAFFQLDEDPFYYKEEMNRKNICVKTVKKYIEKIK